MEEKVELHKMTSGSHTYFKYVLTVSNRVPVVVIIIMTELNRFRNYLYLQFYRIYSIAKKFVTLVEYY